jgi:hypothetical protein
VDPTNTKQNGGTPWPDSASEIYIPSDSRLSAKLVPTFADRGCCVISATDPYGRNLGFLDQNKTGWNWTKSEHSVQGLCDV